MILCGSCGEVCQHWERTARRKQGAVFHAILLAWQEAEASYFDVHLTAHSFTFSTGPLAFIQPSQHTRVATRILWAKLVCDGLSSRKGKMIPGLWSCPRIALLLQKHIPLVSRKELITKMYECAGNSHPAQPGKLRQTRSKQQSAPAARQHSLTCSQQSHQLTGMSARKYNCLQPGNEETEREPHTLGPMCVILGCTRAWRLFCPQFSHTAFPIPHSRATGHTASMDNMECHKM